MGVAAIGGYEHANERGMDLWEAVYPNVLLVALTDTFSTEVFYQVRRFTVTFTYSVSWNSKRLRQDFVKDPKRAGRWSALRQDSGDPFVYAPRAREIYQSMNIDHTKKVIIYSDGLTVEKALALKKQCDEIGFTGACLRFEKLGCGLQCKRIASFGIGTSLTNDFKSVSSGRKERNKALNMVIKLYQVGGKFCAKISDELTKVWV